MPANSRMAMMHPMMPFVPYAAKNCMASCPEANPDPINVAMTAPANFTTVIGRTARSFCSDAIKPSLSLPEPRFAFCPEDSCTICPTARARDQARRYSHRFSALRQPRLLVSSRVAAITRYR